MPAASGLLLPHTILPGADQMALDGAMLRWAAAAPDRFVARTYGWTRPTLSLGRAEPFPEGWDLTALRADGVDVVRRPTGGDAVLHADEVTFAVAASVPGPWAASPRVFAGLVAEALADALSGLELDARVVTRPEARRSAHAADAPGALPCFARAAAGEVQVGRYKAAGIASRFTKGAALSHASLPLNARHREVARYRRDRVAAAAELAAHARSIGESLEAPVDPAAVRALVLAALAGRFAVRLEAGSIEEPVPALP